MIRRDFKLDDGTPGWLLMSQVDHARMSGELTRRWHESFSQEVIDAIAHHDDGWAAWEMSPQIDSRHGRPYSFLEMPLAEGLAIWDGSIAAAERIGPLAAAIVAGHFISLGSGSEHGSRPLAQAWLRTMADKHTGWLAAWQRLSPDHTLEVAARGQQMLLVADLLSLWLCCDGPVASGDDSAIPNAEMQARSATVLGKYRFTTHDKSAGGGQFAWQGSLTPWPFSVGELTLAAPAIAAPQARYQSWPEIAAAGRAVRLRWRLRETLPPSGEC